MSCTVLVYGVAKGRGSIPARTSVCHTPHIEIKNAPPGRFHHSRGAERPNCNRPRSGHLSGRVAAPTRVGEAGGSRNLTGASPPHKRFSLGLHPVSLGKTKEMGWKQQHKVKTTNSNTASSAQPKPTPGRGWNPAPTRGSEERGRAGGGRRKGSSRTPTPTGPCGTGRVLLFCGARVAAREMVKTPPIRAAFSTFHLKYTNPEPLFSGYPSVQASAPQSGQVFPAARSSSM